MAGRSERCKSARHHSPRIDRAFHSYFHGIKKTLGAVARTSWTLLKTLLMLPESKGLCSAELGSLLFDAPHTPLARLFVFLVSHLHIILRRTPHFVGAIESTVAAIQNVDLWIRQMGILVHVMGAVSTTNVLSPVSESAGASSSSPLLLT